MANRNRGGRARPRLLTLVAAVCALCAILPGMADAAAATGAKPKPSSCSATRENQSVHVRFRILEKLQRVTQGQSEGLPPTVVNVKPPAHHHFGAMTIGAATCHSPKGWRVLSPLRVTTSSVGLYVNADNQPAPRGNSSTNGWGIGAERMHHGVLDVHAIACTQGHLWKDVRRVASIPVPGVSYAVSLVQWVATTFLPAPKDKINCGDLGIDHLHVSANSHGKLRVTSPSHGQDMTGIYQSSDQGNDVTLEHTRVIRPPIIH
jgi:hypothetical protein